MKTVITGASGLVGGNLAHELVARGHQVRATRRGSSKVKQLEKLPIEWVEADLSSVEALAKAFDGAEAVFHCAAQVTVVKKINPAIHAANVEGTAHVLEAVKKAGVKRLVYCSTVGAVGLSENGQPCDERVKWNYDKYGMDDAYVTTKHQAEELVRAAAAAGQDVVIVNPTYMFGPYDARPSSGRLIVEVAKGRVPGVTPGSNNFVDVRDVTRGMLLAFEKGVKGERYILGGQNLTYGEIYALICRVVGRQPPTRNVPRWMSRPIGWFGDLQEAITGREPLLNSVQVAYGYCSTFIFSSERAKRELGYTVSSLEQAIRDAVDWFKANGML